MKYTIRDSKIKTFGKLATGNHFIYKDMLFVRIVSVGDGLLNDKNLTRKFNTFCISTSDHLLIESETVIQPVEIINIELAKL